VVLLGPANVLDSSGRPISSMPAKGYAAGKSFENLVRRKFAVLRRRVNKDARHQHLKRKGGGDDDRGTCGSGERGFSASNKDAIYLSKSLVAARKDIVEKGRRRVCASAL